MDLLTKTLAIVFLTTTMAAIGLQVAIGEIVAALGHRSLMIRSLVANLIVVPALRLPLVRIVPMSRDAGVGLILLAAAPGGLIAINSFPGTNVVVAVVTMAGADRNSDSDALFISPLSEMIDLHNSRVTMVLLISDLNRVTVGHLWANQQPMLELQKKMQTPEVEAEYEQILFEPPRSSADARESLTPRWCLPASATES